jgi:hypothetical protein
MLADGLRASRLSVCALNTEAANARRGFDALTPPYFDGQWLTKKCMVSVPSRPFTYKISRVAKEGSAGSETLIALKN